MIEGAGSLAGAGKVAVGGPVHRAKTIVLATGSVKRPIPGTHFGGRVIGTEEAWALPSCRRRWRSSARAPRAPRSPPRYARLGVEVLLFEALDRVLPTEDADISKLAERGLKRQGMTIHTGTLVQDVESARDGVKFTYGEAGGRGRTGW